MSHIEHMHEMIEKLTDCTKQAIENDDVCVGQYPISDCVDMIKDLNEASYYASIVKAMKEADEEKEEEEKYMLKRFKEEYGEEDGERRYYDDYRYMRTGRFAPKGRGTFTPGRSGRSRRGYEEPHRMTAEMYHEHDPEYYRDLDREELGRMYYSGNMSGMGGNRSGSSSYGGSGNSDGRRNYDGDGRNSSNRSESRYEKARRGYEEAKELHKGDKQMTMKEAEKFTDVALDELFESLEDTSPEVKAMVKSKAMTRLQKM